jgi:hypothetical protein
LVSCRNMMKSGMLLSLGRPLDLTLASLFAKKNARESRAFED